MTSDAEIRALIERLRQYEGRNWENTLCYNGLRDEAAAALSAMLEERGGCDPDGCKGHIDAFMRRAEAAEAERDAMAVQLAYANVAQEQEG